MEDDRVKYIYIHINWLYIDTYIHLYIDYMYIYSQNLSYSINSFYYYYNKIPQKILYDYDKFIG